MQRKIKIILNHPDKLDLGGVSGFYSTLEKKYSRSKYEVKHFRVGKVHRNAIMRIPGARVLDFVIRLVTFCLVLLKEKPDIFHVNPSTDAKSIIRDSTYVRLSKLLNSKTKILVHFRGWNEMDIDNFDGKDLIAWSARSLLRNADHVIVLAEKFRIALESYIICNNVSVIPSVVDVVLFEEYCLSSDSQKIPQVLFLSRMIEAKGVFDIVQSINDLKNICIERNLRFLLAGDGPARGDVFSELKNLDLTEYVSMPGYLRNNEKYRAFSESTIFLLPSYGEGCPNALLEAMAAGLAIVATDVGAISELIEPEVNGLIVPEGDHIAITKAILRLIDNDCLRIQMGKNNLIKVKRIADVDVVFSRISHIYKSLLN